MRIAQQTMIKAQLLTATYHQGGCFFSFCKKNCV